MITLHGSTARFGLPSASTFVCKAEVLLKMAGLSYRHVDANFSRAPKGKIPFIEADGKLLGDSTFIRLYLEQQHGANFDAGLDASQRAVAHAFEVMCDEHLYWAVVHARWTVKENFDRGPRHFFDSAPWIMRPIIIAMVKRSVTQALKGQGFGRHSKAEVEQLAIRDIDALAAFIANKPFLMGNEPCGADASVWSAITSVLCPHFTTPIRDHAARHENLVAYSARGMARWFSELAHAAEHRQKPSDGA